MSHNILETKYFTWNALLIATAIVLAAFLLGNAFKNRNNYTNKVTVTGLGSQDFISDLIVWRGSFSRKSMDQKAAYDALAADRKTVKQYLISKGVAEKEIVFGAVGIDRQFDNRYDDNGKYISVFSGYNLYQDVTIESHEVDKIENLSREITELINSGVELNSSSPSYYYTKLADLKIQMIEAATKDAKLRAEKIAANAGSKISTLKKADMGVFQIVGKNAAEDDYSWGGTFNTTSKEKTANITVKLEYALH